MKRKKNDSQQGYLICLKFFKNGDDVVELREGQALPKIESNRLNSPSCTLRETTCAWKAKSDNLVVLDNATSMRDKAIFGGGLTHRAGEDLCSNVATTGPNNTPMCPCNATPKF